MSPRSLVVLGIALSLGCVGSLESDALAGPPGSSPRTGGGCTGDCVGTMPIAAITQEEYGYAALDVLGVPARVDGLPADGALDQVPTNAAAPRGPDAASAYETIASETGDAAGPVLAARCGDAACVDGLVRAAGALLFRRALTDEEARALVDLHDTVSAESGHVDGLSAVVSALLQSPDFLYRVERGVGDASVRALDGNEVAGRLAAFLWRSVPDAALLAAAAAGRLESDDGIRVEVHRMMDDPRFDRAIASFHESWLSATIVAPRDGLDPAIVAEMREELSRYTVSILRSDRPTLQHLLTEPRVPLSATLAAYYGVQRPASDWATVEMPDRAGVLGRGLSIVASSHSSETRSIHRGLLVYRRMLCRQVGAPPASATAVTSAFVRDPAWSDREYVTHLTMDHAPCAGCHRSFGPLGFAFDDIDVLGRSLPGATNTDGTLDDMAFGSLVDLEGLLSDGEVEDCVVRRWLAFALGRGVDATDVQSLAATGAALHTGRGELDLRQLVESVTLARTFRARRFAP